MSPIRSFDHVGITVRDLDAVTAFFVGIGFAREGRATLEGDFLDSVIGMPRSRTERSCRTGATRIASEATSQSLVDP